jgi:hypothetical protein
MKKKNDLAHAGKGTVFEAASASADVLRFLKSASRVPAPRDVLGRLAVIVAATSSRQPTWDIAAHIQGEMFEAALDHGGLEVQLTFFRGFEELKRTRWLRDPKRMQSAMASVNCRAGHTQIARALDALGEEARKQPVAAFVYVGDACEEPIDAIGHAAGQLGARGIRGFVFLEGHDQAARYAFQQIAALTRGTLERFDVNAPERLRTLLGSAAAYAAGGARAMQAYAARRRGQERETVLRISHQLGGRG